MSRDPRDVIVRPVVSEKSIQQNETGKYCFEVSPFSSKIEVRHAVEKLFKVHVTKVNSLKVRGKPRRFRFSRGRTKGFSKVVVTLKEGEKIELFE